MLDFQGHLSGKLIISFLPSILIVFFIIHVSNSLTYRALCYRQTISAFQEFIVSFEGVELRLSKSRANIGKVKTW